MLRTLSLLAMLATLPASAHDFWVQPESFRAAPEATLPLTLQVGHGPYRQRSPLAVRRIVRFQDMAPDGAVTDLRPDLHPGGATEDGAVRLTTPGTHVLVLETDDKAQSHLPALRFNDYLVVEGLTPALELRRAAGRMDADGAENYSRRAKALVRVGDFGDGALATRPQGLTLEIVPEVDPYAQPQPADLPVRVYYEGRSLAGALVKLTDLAHDAEPVETHRTDAEGRARFPMPASGDWLLNVVWTKPQPPTAETDFETVFSSLSFGFPRR
ncbi:DUF4198 domain-containing protein [Nitrospirillum sp. BR 11163]|uniref:DUF4198 domain-containing protein n=1 Tax=Nitrospirillum sp. BR 11163 TaxID=3104323 RepID=UPI002AFF238A|nr:DUF4198 domain-containing protein [Nitrospirillum sp. BR 11163]MEA1675164.1 DUF4198 domain-containing protein [Nitrospirillum sp. BR 11163]